jgi:hypothetical protein
VVVVTRSPTSPAILCGSGNYCTKYNSPEIPIIISVNPTKVPTSGMTLRGCNPRSSGSVYQEEHTEQPTNLESFVSTTLVGDGRLHSLILKAWAGQTTLRQNTQFSRAWTEEVTPGNIQWKGGGAHRRPRLPGQLAAVVRRQPTWHSHGIPLSLGAKPMRMLRYPDRGEQRSQPPR